MNRRRFVRAASIGAVAGLGAMASHAQVEPAELITGEMDAAVSRGLAYLARGQSTAGSWDEGQSPNIAVTALAALALMSGGHHPGRGIHGRAVSKALDYFLTRGHGEPPGYLHGGGDIDNHGRMYEHGFGTLFLAELSGMLPSGERQRRLRDLLERSIGITLRAQNKDGGWRYQPKNTGDADVSVTVAQLMALRAAKNAGVFVPKGTVDKAVDYIRACQLPDGGFRYIKGVDVGGSAFPRSAAALVGLYSAGIYDDPACRRALRYIQQFPPSARAGIRDPRMERYYYYAHYYAALAMWTAGGTAWTSWFPTIRDDLLLRARTGPSNVWNDFTHGSAYATAMACIILQLPNNYLPILQK